jgi:pimeloyl-ACP methyl ester carboxylesterase
MKTLQALLPFLLLIGATGVACSGAGRQPSADAEPTQRGYDPELTRGACDFKLPLGRSAEGVECGYLSVPEDRDDPNGRQVELAYAVLKATGPEARPDPIVYLHGGPGLSALEGDMQSFTPQFAGPLAERDLVFFDQRGTGLSRPRLDCPEYAAAAADAELLDPAEAKETTDGAWSACRARLEGEGVQINAYNSVESAADVSDLMSALNYSDWNIFGVSYGTRVALTALRDDPQNIRSVVLDSTVPLQANEAPELARDLETRLEALIAACAEDADCAARYPNLESTLFDLVADLETSPRTVAGGTGEASGDVTIRSDRVFLALRSLFSSTTHISRIPSLISDWAAGDVGLLARSGFLGSAADAFAWGTERAVTCNEEAPFYSDEVIEAATTGVRPEIAAAFEPELHPCDGWGNGSPSDEENQAVSSDIPVLLLAGEYDMATSAANAMLASETLSNSYVLLFPATGHIVSFSHPECSLSIVAAFLANPMAEPDSGCIPALPGLQFR